VPEVSPLPVACRRPRRSSRPLRAILLVLLLAVAAVACSSDDTPELVDADGPSPSERAAATPCDADVGPLDHLVLEATTEPELDVYDAPGATAPSQTLPSPKLINDDPNAPVPLVLLAKSTPTDDDCAWIEAYLPVRPNGATGWVKREDVKVSRHDYRMVVNLDEFNLTAYKGDDVVLDAPIAVARDNTPTPGGLYYTTELIAPPDPDSVYGVYAYGLSGFSEVLESFNGGPGQLGIHGTNEPDKIGTKVSSGCIRLTNEDITVLVEDVGLPLGVPVEILQA
jgi:hypothetical protein